MVGIPRADAPHLPRTGSARLDRVSLLDKGPLFRPTNRFGKILPSRLTGQSVAVRLPSSNAT
jgi:hypothetical protein